jgi:hypothetical protein
MSSERVEPTCPRHRTPSGDHDVPEEQSKETSGFSRRTLLKGGVLGGVVAAGTAVLGTVGELAVLPARPALAATDLPDIQFDIGNFIPAAFTVNDGAGDITVRFATVFTNFATYTLSRTPNKADQLVLANALNTIEKAYPFSPSGVFTFISYGLPYFNRLPQNLVQTFVPRLRSNANRLVLEEAVPSPTDVSPQNPGITKLNFNVPVVIERNDVTITLRSDKAANISDVLGWLGGSNRLAGRVVASPPFRGLFTQTSNRVMFQQIGLPRKVADQNHLPFAGLVNPDSSMWMGFVDQQTDGSAPDAQTVTFAGSSHARLTTSFAGQYFDNGAVQHLSHDIQDLGQFYANDEPFTERCQYMFRSNPIPSEGNADQFTNGGGPAFIDNVFQGAGDAALNAQGINTFEGERRMGHLSALQRSSRAADGTPLHIRMDGTGFDSLDVPDHSNRPKLQFTAFVPTAEFFRAMRVNQASLDLVEQFGVEDEDNGLERFLTATRRQNFLAPPRRHRAFPLVELT